MIVWVNMSIKISVKMIKNSMKIVKIFVIFERKMSKKRLKMMRVFVRK